MTPEETQANLDEFNRRLNALLKEFGYSGLKASIEVVPLIINETTPMSDDIKEDVAVVDAPEAPVEETPVEEVEAPTAE